MKRMYKIAAAVAGAIIIALSAYVIVLDNERVSLERRVSAIYQKSFDELKSDMDSLGAKLCKIEAASADNQYSMLLLDAWRQTGDTESSIAALPVSFESTSTLTQFMNRTGDYCRYLFGKIAQGEGITSEDMAQIKSLANSCGEISLKLEDIWRQGYSVDIALAGSAFLSQELTGNDLDFKNQDFPRLIYDGPFSESTENKKPEDLGDEQVSLEQAKKAAAAFMGLDEGALADGGEMGGDIPCFAFTGSENGSDFSICITKQGGQVLWYMSQRETGISAVPTDERYEQLAGIAKQYLADKGYGETAASYAQFYGGMAVINLAPRLNGVVLYPDLIKVWVDISANDVAGMDARNYIMSHKQRDIPSAELSITEAMEKLNKDIQLTNTRLAIIPLDTNEEKLCWEFTGTIEERDFIIYINAKTGAEEDILMIEHTNEGSLVM